MQEDVHDLWTYVLQNYPYLDTDVLDWKAVPELYRGDIAQVHDRNDLITLLENVVDELADPHAQLTANTGSSPRLVPSGADVWAAWENGRALILEVRGGSDAERTGIKPGTIVESFDGVPIADPSIDASDVLSACGVRRCVIGRCVRY